MSATEKKAPEISLYPEMIERAAQRLHDIHGTELEEAREDACNVLLAAFEDVPVTNYGIGLALQFFDLVICVKDFENRPAAGVYQATSEDAFDSLPHNIDVSYGFVGDGRVSERTRYIKRIAISKLPAPKDVD